MHKRFISLNIEYRIRFDVVQRFPLLERIMTAQSAVGELWICKERFRSCFARFMSDSLIISSY